ncbi:MAG: helix-turn-helix domain-containing protein [Rudaea sp.]|uniref:helix-turn-helix domain-containing protein n=1 Tax=Rudaea sp. TaxID=2136325 RepID=UPI0039E4D866
MAFFETADEASGNDAAAATPADETSVDATVESVAVAPGQATLFPESLVQRLVAARDARGWNSQQVAARLHLPLHIVQSIEAGQYERIDQGVYLRGYLTNYARLVGVPLDAVEDVLRGKAPPPPELVATGQISHSRYLVERYSGSALYLVLTGVIFVPLVMFAMNMGGSVGSRLTPLDAPVPALTSTESDAAASTAAATTAAADTPATAPATESHDSPLMASFAIVPTLPAMGGAKPDTVAAAGSQLRLSLAEASWVEIVDADGKRLEYSTLPAGTTKEYPAEKSLTILLGNTSGVRVEVAGQAQDIAPYNRGNVARFKLAAGSRSITTAASEHNG